MNAIGNEHGVVCLGKKSRSKVGIVPPHVVSEQLVIESILSSQQTMHTHLLGTSSTPSASRYFTCGTMGLQCSYAAIQSPFTKVARIVLPFVLVVCSHRISSSRSRIRSLVLKVRERKESGTENKDVKLCRYALVIRLTIPR